MYEVKLSSKALKFYNKCDKPTSKRIEACLEILEKDPFSASDIKPLKGELEGLYRIRVGTLRIIFEVIENELKVYVINISPRGGAYK